MNGESRLKVLRAVVALKEFTTRDVMGWTHLKRGQVIPRLADLRKEKIIEYDLEYGPKEAAEKADVIRPAHRPIQHYRLSLESANRQKAFAEIGRVRSLFGEDPLAHKLAVIEGRLKELAKQLESIKNQKDIIDRKRYADYEASLSDTGVSLDEAILEMDIEDKSLGSKLSQLRKLHQKLQSELLELRSKPVQVHETDRIRELLPSFFHHIKGQPFTLPQLETVENDLKPIMVQMQELYDMLGSQLRTTLRKRD